MQWHFDWDEKKNSDNIRKHGVSFFEAQHAFGDPHRVIAQDLAHSNEESRFYCFGKINNDILTVRFTYRNDVIRIIGAGYWRKGKKIYEQENALHG
jgi:uncharacterized DUF497 family protein